MQVGVVQAGNDAPSAQVDDPGFRPALELIGVVHADHAPVLDDEFARFGLLRVERGDAAVAEDEIRRSHFFGCNQD